MIRYITYLGILCIGTSAYVHGLTFNVDLTDLAEVDIFVSKTAPGAPSIFSKLFYDPQKTFAAYSLVAIDDSSMKSWWALYGFGVVNTIMEPQSRFWIPSRKDNPAQFIVTPEQLKQLAGDATMTQVYITVRQRTYSYDSSQQKLVFFNYCFAVQGFYPLNAVIAIQTSGIIHPTKIGTVPAHLSNVYTQAGYCVP